MILLIFPNNIFILKYENFTLIGMTNMSTTLKEEHFLSHHIHTNDSAYISICQILHVQLIKSYLAPFMLKTEVTLWNLCSVSVNSVNQNVTFTTFCLSNNKQLWPGLKST